jgi:hypothetical protein
MKSVEKDMQTRKICSIFVVHFVMDWTERACCRSFMAFVDQKRFLLGERIVSKKSRVKTIIFFFRHCRNYPPRVCSGRHYSTYIHASQNYGDTL